MRPQERARVEVLLDAARHEEARDLARRLLAEHPDDAPLHGLLCRALIGVGEHRAALDAANRYVGLAPDSPWAHELCAHALSRLDQPQEAARAAREAVRLRPEDSTTHQLFAQVAVAIPSQSGAAWQAALRGVHLAPDSADAHFTVGFVASRRHDRDTAVRAYRRTLAIDPEHPTAQHNLAMIGSGRSLRRRAEGLGGALRGDPQRRVFRVHADDWTDRVVRRAWAGAVLLALVTLLSAWAGLVVAVALAWWGRRLTRQVPAGMRRLLALRVRRSPYLLGLAVTILLALALAALAALPAPDRGSAVSDALGVVLVLWLLSTLVMLGWTAVRVLARHYQYHPFS